MSNAGYGNHEAPPPGRGASAAAPGSAAQPTSRAPKDASSAALPDDERREVATPGDGAGPTAPQGDEVDPGAG